MWIQTLSTKVYVEIMMLTATPTTYTIKCKCHVTSVTGEKVASYFKKTCDNYLVLLIANETCKTELPHSDLLHSLPLMRLAALQS